jgi:hypothetical protein
MCDEVVTIRGRTREDVAADLRRLRELVNQLNALATREDVNRRELATITNDLSGISHGLSEALVEVLADGGEE